MCYQLTSFSRTIWKSIRKSPFDDFFSNRNGWFYLHSEFTWFLSKLISEKSGWMKTSVLKKGLMRLIEICFITSPSKCFRTLLTSISTRDKALGIKWVPFHLIRFRSSYRILIIRSWLVCNSSATIRSWSIRSWSKSAAVLLNVSKISYFKALSSLAGFSYELKNVTNISRCSFLTVR